MHNKKTLSERNNGPHLWTCQHFKILKLKLKLNIHVMI